MTTKSSSSEKTTSATRARAMRGGGKGKPSATPASAGESSAAKKAKRIAAAWTELIEKLEKPRADEITSLEMESWAKEDAPPGARMTAGAALAQLPGHGMPKTLALVLGAFCEEKDFDGDGGRRILGASERLILAVKLLGCDSDASTGSQGQRLVSPGRLKALEMLLGEIGAGRINELLAETRGLSLLEWIMQEKPQASWALPSLVKMGMSLLSGTGGITAAHLAIKSWEKSKPEESLLAALAAGAPAGASGMAGPPLDLAVQIYLERPAFRHLEISMNWMQLLADYGASVNERGGADGHTILHTAMRLSPPGGPAREGSAKRVIEFLEKEQFDWRAKDVWGNVAVHEACHKSRMAWLDLVKNKDMGWNIRNARGKTFFDVFLGPGIASGSENDEAWGHLASELIPEALRAVSSGEKLLLKKETKGEKSAETVENKAGDEQPAMELAFMEWFSGLPEELKERVTSEAKKWDGVTSQQKEQEAESSDSLLAAANKMRTIWSAEGTRCVGLGAFGHASPQERELAAESAKALREASLEVVGAASAWISRNNATWDDLFEAEKPDALKNLAEDKTASDDIRDAMFKAIFSMAASDVLNAAVGVDSRAAWGWENAQPDGITSEAKAFLEDRMKHVADVKLHNEKLTAGKEKKTLGEWKFGGRALLALDDSPLAMAAGQRGSGAPRGKPPEPTHQVYAGEDFKNFKNQTSSNSSDNEIFEKFVKKAGSRAEREGLTKKLAIAEKMLDGIAELRVDFPHFDEVLDHIEDHCSLQMSGDGSFFIPPMLLVGGPGVGKTFFFQKVSELVSTSYQVLHMESMTGGFMITGLSSRWSTGSTGCIFELLTSGPTANPIVLLDEIDKCQDSSFSPTESVLLPLLEPHSAREFQDECLPLKLDARKICWVATANQLQNVSMPIRSRLDVFEVRAPNAFERRSLSLGVYKSILKANAWGAKMSKELSVDVLIKASEAQGPGATRDLRRALTTACAKALRDGRNFIKVEDLPNATSKKQALWNAALGDPASKAA